MTNKIMMIEMAETAYGIGGVFRAKADFRLDNFLSPFYDIDVIIDTGCSISTIPLKRLKVSDTLCKVLKGADISDKIPYYLSYGVESGGLKHKEPVTDEEKMVCPAMKFEHKISDFTIEGVDISCNKICLNYDRNGNMLIGMDILQNWHIHMGISKVTGKNLFLACPKENVCQDFKELSEKHFVFPML